MRPHTSRYLEQRMARSRTVVLILLWTAWLVVIAAVILLASMLTKGSGS